MTGEYDDIINLPHHVSKTRPQMSMLERAAQFAPFQALTGYGAAIQETARRTEDKIELGDEDVALLNAKLQVLADHLPENPEVCIVWFKPDERKPGGSYVKTTGKVKRIDDVAGLISLQSGEKIRLESIVNIESEMFSKSFP